jgi:hypothetical protein
MDSSSDALAAAAWGSQDRSRASHQDLQKMDIDFDGSLYTATQWLAGSSQSVRHTMVVVLQSLESARVDDGALTLPLSQ